MARPLAVVYSDDATGPDDGDDTAALASMLAEGPLGFDVVTAGPRGETTVREALARPEVVLHAQPGGGGDDSDAFRRQRGDKGAIRDFVAAGGRYLGVCMGAYLAERAFFDLFPGRVDSYCAQRGATVADDDPAIVTVLWRGAPRRLFYQDGGVMVPRRRARGEVIALAHYPDRSIAAAVTPFGSGRVGLCGPHPEAPQAWFDDAGLPGVGPTRDLGDDLVVTLMEA